MLIDPAALSFVSVETTPDRGQNLVFCRSPPADHAGPFSQPTYS